MSYVRYRRPTVLFQVNGEPAPEITEARVSFAYTDRIGKRNTAALVLADPKRLFRDGGLQPDDHYLVAWGYPGNFCRPRDLVLKEWTCNDDDSFPKVMLTLQDTGKSPKVKGRNQSAATELHKNHESQHWGMRTSSAIAKIIASRHGLTAIVEDSDDMDDVAQLQPMNTSDYAYLRRASENIDWEFFIENGKLYYRAKPYSEPSRQEFFYLPQQGNDTLLISFTPKAKVTVVSTKPTGKSVQVAEPPWILQARDDVAVQAAELFNADTDAAAQALVTIVEKAGDDHVTAEDLRAELAQDSSDVSTNLEYQEQMALLTERAQQFQQAKKEFDAGRKGSGKVNLRQKSKVVGADERGNANCPKGQQKPGSTPTGDARGGIVVELRGKSPVGRSVGSVQSVVTTTAGTEKQRRKLACASHSKRKDRAVTASAVFVGDPVLRSKVNYTFRNVGTLYEGTWYAKQVTHNFDPSGTYRVSMDLKRGALKKLNKNNSAANAAPEEEVTAYVVGLRDDTRRGLETLGGQSVPLDISPTGTVYTTADGRIVSTPKNASVPDY